MFAGLQLERFSVKKQNVPRSVCIPFYRVHKTRFVFVLFSCYSEYGSSSRVTALAWTGLFPRGFQSVPRGFLFFGDAFPLQTGHAAVRPRNKHGVFSEITIAILKFQNFFQILRGCFRRLRGFRNYYGVFKIQTP